MATVTSIAQGGRGQRKVEQVAKQKEVQRKEDNKDRLLGLGLAGGTFLAVYLLSRVL